MGTMCALSGGFSSRVGPYSLNSCRIFLSLNEEVAHPGAA